MISVTSEHSCLDNFSLVPLERKTAVSHGERMRSGASFLELSDDDEGDVAQDESSDQQRLQAPQMVADGFMITDQPSVGFSFPSLDPTTDVESVDIQQHQDNVQQDQGLRIRVAPISVPLVLRCGLATSDFIPRRCNSYQYDTCSLPDLNSGLSTHQSSEPNLSSCTDSHSHSALFDEGQETDDWLSFLEHFGNVAQERRLQRDYQSSGDKLPRRISRLSNEVRVVSWTLSWAGLIGEEWKQCGGVWPDRASLADASDQNYRANGGSVRRATSLTMPQTDVQVTEISPSTPSARSAPPFYQPPTIRSREYFSFMPITRQQVLEARFQQFKAKFMSLSTMQQDDAPSIFAPTGSTASTDHYASGRASIVGVFRFLPLSRVSATHRDKNSVYTFRTRTSIQRKVKRAFKKVWTAIAHHF